MEWEFENKHLENLYTKGKSPKFKFVDKMLCVKFVAKVGVIEAAETIYDLRTPPSMEFKALEGYENRFSIRLDKKHRLEFEIDFEDEERTFGSVKIVTVSQHYH